MNTGTNGSLITEELAERIGKAGLRAMWISIEGPDAEQPVTLREIVESLGGALGQRRRYRGLPVAPAYALATLSDRAGKVLEREMLTRLEVANLTRHLRFSGRRAHEALGFQSLVSFEVGIRETVRWYRGNPSN